MILKSQFIEGERLILREVRHSDVSEQYYAWMNNPEITRYLETRFFPNSIESLREYVIARQSDRNNVFLAIVEKESDQHIGNIKLGPIDWIHRTGEVGLVIGEKTCWGKGYASEAIGLIIEYGFNRLNLHKLTAGCYADNKGSERAFLKKGFAIEGVKKSQYYINGKYTDLTLLGIINQHL